MRYNGSSEGLFSKLGCLDLLVIITSDLDIFRCGKNFLINFLQFYTFLMLVLIYENVFVRIFRFSRLSWVGGCFGFCRWGIDQWGAACSHPRLVSTATRQNSELTAARFYDVIKTSQIRILVKNKGALFREVTRLWASSLIPDSPD